MQRAGFRQLDLQLEEEIFGRPLTPYVPGYSSEKTAAELVARRLLALHPEWTQRTVEDHWGYTVSWHSPWPSGSNHLVLVGEHRSPVLPVALCRAALNAHRNFERYKQRLLARQSGEPSAPRQAVAPRPLRRTS